VATTTKAAERARAAAEYNAFLAVCPSRQLLDRISDKWVVLVLCALGGDASSGTGAAAAPRALRYSELARLLAGVSQKMLTQTLRALERDGLLTRTVVPTVPVTVSYELTDLGRSLLEVARGLRRWAQDHMPEVLAHRDAYDGAAS
jgi:DNA-binding HxlR family transcriptional regulator